MIEQSQQARSRCSPWLLIKSTLSSETQIELILEVHTQQLRHQISKEIFGYVAQNRSLYVWSQQGQQGKSRQGFNIDEALQQILQEIVRRKKTHSETGVKNASLSHLQRGAPSSQNRGTEEMLLNGLFNPRVFAAVMLKIPLPVQRIAYSSSRM